MVTTLVTICPSVTLLEGFSNSLDSMKDLAKRAILASGALRLVSPVRVRRS